MTLLGALTLVWVSAPSTTTVILAFSISEEEHQDDDGDLDGYAVMIPINAWLREYANGQQFHQRELDSDSYGGDGLSETVLYVAAFEDFDEGAFLDFLDGELSLDGSKSDDVVGWQEPDEVEVLVKRSDEEGFRILWPDTRWGDRPRRRSRPESEPPPRRAWWRR